MRERFPTALILFDIDGTLVRRAGPHHRQALVDAVRAVTGRESTTEGIPVHGMLDTDILSDMMRNAGMNEEAISEALPAIMEAAQDLYEHSVPDIRDKRCPGVEDFLIALTARGTILALVTGNLPRIAWRKLDRAGLAHYFHFGAFAGSAATRGGLARRAIEEARRENLIAPDSPIALIGDAVQDVQAARENGIVAVAVRTGITPPEELEATHPDMLLDDLTDFSAILKLSECARPAPFSSSPTPVTGN